MKTFHYTIQDELGIHARPAGMLVKEARKYTSKINIRKGNQEASISQLLKLMSLAVKKGEEVTITVEGTDEKEAYDAIYAFFKKNL